MRDGAANPAGRADARGVFLRGEAAGVAYRAPVPERARVEREPAEFAVDVELGRRTVYIPVTQRAAWNAYDEPIPGGLKL